ncbi:MAG: hypothetical protein VB060_11230 [Oscillibacter sp.]|uniref:hypothetical protein n=1 Tax=Oscillibacter sp. TaxID=1945593 RepID=UPI002896899E|nr:hypothetical protein [Oscillibacter sp.]MEA4994370.1 hypothetical protein [Oscillibacter sp.]
MKTAPDKLTPLSAGRLLGIWRDVAAQEENETVRGLLCNARVLAESCFLGGERLFESAEAVLEELTAGEMETLVRHLAGKKTDLPAEVNAGFDPERFRAMRGKRA